MALTLLASRWARSHGGRAVGLTVDHALRAESAGEARKVGHWLNDLGIDHHIVTWAAAKPKTGIQKKAREARYALLTNWCLQAGILHLLVAHHREDQAETIALRQARGSGPEGLAGMASIRDLPNLRLLRPLLGTDKARLIATLSCADHSWIEDPSNHNPAFARNKIRQEGLDLEALSEQAVLYGRSRQAWDKQVQRALVDAVKIHPAGFARVSKSCLADMPADLMRGLISRVLMTIGGCIYPPRTPSLRRLLDEICARQPCPNRTLSNCRIIDQQSTWLVCREKASSSASVEISEEFKQWDDRFLVRYRGKLQGLNLRQLGDHHIPSSNQTNHRENRYRIPFMAKPGLPSVWRDSRLVAVPHLGFFDLSFDPSVLDLIFRPVTPLANPPFAAHMC